jgi:CelD/BcsL family acetyltransferase involved in cellulose biosynthesis
VVDDDPLASVYQTSGWCMPWYRCYRDAFDPYVIVVTAGGRTVGLVPMAVDRDARTGVRQQRHGRLPRHRALPGYREAVSGN